MSQNLLKLQIINGRTRQAVVDEANDSFGFKEIRIGGVTLTEETVSGLSYATLQSVSGVLQSEIDALDVRIDGVSGVIDSILANNPDQWRTVVSEVSGQTVFDVLGFTFDVIDNILDIEVFINGRRYPQCVVGDFSTGAFRKNSTTQIELQELVPYNAEVIVWRQGTSSGGGGGGGSTDLDNITTNPKPAVAAGQSLGTLAKPWSGLYLKDTVTSQVYLLQIVSGTFQALEVP
jgi:hypothetical protein